jgi:hypothetical protein
MWYEYFQHMSFEQRVVFSTSAVYIEGILGLPFNVKFIEICGLLHLIGLYRGNSRDHPFKYYNRN